MRMHANINIPLRNNMQHTFCTILYIKKRAAAATRFFENRSEGKK